MNDFRSCVICVRDDLKTKRTIIKFETPETGVLNFIIVRFVFKFLLFKFLNFFWKHITTTSQHNIDNKVTFVHGNAAYCC